MSRPTAKTKHDAIVRANAELIKTLDKLEVTTLQESDISRLTKTCWGCGTASGDHKMTRAHVVARGQGGSDDPSNFFLLCDSCHEDQPDGMPREIQENWLKNREWWDARFFKMWSGWMDELSQKYGGDPQAYMHSRGSTQESIKAMVGMIKQAYSSAAGFKNARANMFAALEVDYVEWVKSAATT